MCESVCVCVIIYLTVKHNDQLIHIKLSSVQLTDDQKSFIEKEFLCV